VKQVFVPIDNKKDIDSMKKDDPGLFTDGFEVILVENLSQVLEYVLIDFDKSYLTIGM